MSSKFEKDVYKKFKEIDAKFEQIDKRFEEIDARFEKIENVLVTMQDTMLSMQKSIETMNRSIILIEYKVTTEIPALFDGYSMHQQKQEIQQENLTSLNIKVEEHDIRISDLEQAIV